MDAALLPILLGAVAAGFVQGLSGFAFGLVAMSFWAWSVSPQMAGPLVVACSLIGQSLAIGPIRRGFDLTRVLPFVIGGAIGVPLGTAVVPLVDQTLFRCGVGAILVVWCPAMLAARALPRITGGGRLADGGIGVIGGIMGGLGGLTGTPVTLWCTLRGWDKETQRATLQAFNIAMHTLTLSAYAVAGLLTRETAHLMAVAVPAMIVPVLLGMRFYARVNDIGFRRIVLGLLFLSGLLLLGTSLPSLTARWFGG